MVFTPRLTKPEAGNKYYITKAKGGWSTAIVGNPTDKDCNVLSNCVGYAFGRFNEILGDTKMTHLQPVNAENFYAVAQSQGLKTGQEPKLGAVAVWQKGATLSYTDGAGHVAVVEVINADGSIVTSESGYNCKNPFWTTPRKKGADGNWGGGVGYKFLGFIYLPEAVEPTTPPEPTKPVEPTQPTEPTKPVEPVKPVEPAKPVSTRYLKKGMQGGDVKEMQKALINKKYLRPNEADGDFGTITLGALLAFQFENKLSVDGVCGPLTKKALGI